MKLSTEQLGIKIVHAMKDVVKEVMKEEEKESRRPHEHTHAHRDPFFLLHDHCHLHPEPIKTYPSDARAGKPWSSDEEEALKYRLNDFIHHQAINHRRNKGAIAARIKAILKNHFDFHDFDGL